ncbi:MAG: cupin domain-containing protein [Deltaproteobacteria bacterium]
MHKPESIEQGSSFDLVALERELRLDGQYERSGHTARTLVRTSDLRVVLMVMKGQSSIPEHQADETASVQVLSGRVRLRVPSRDVELRSGELFVLGASLRHGVKALEDSAFLLTLAWSDKADPP